MPAPTVVSDFLDCVRKSSVVESRRLDEYLARPTDDAPATPAGMADAMVRDGLLTRFQADQMLRGRWRNFILSGKYTILEPIGAGGMGTVYLCSHNIMRRPVAIKVLPASQADDPGAVERFHREAQAVAQLRHPNIVGAYDVDRDGKFHFLVMEYVDGVNLQDLVKRTGPLDPTRAAHYIHQAALGLEHAHEAGLVHRDIKPANLLVDRQGVVKILDLGLARFFHDKRESVTAKYDGNAVLGTADYLAPEQAVDSHNVDIRCDIYSLGITFYFLLAGRSPFQEGSVAEKLIWHQVRQPKPIRELRPKVPEGLAAVLGRMIAKEPGLRYQTPAEVAAALAPFTQALIDPPSADELPPITPGARLAGVAESNGALLPSPNTPTPAPAKPASGGPRRGATQEQVTTGKVLRTEMIPAGPATMKTAPAAFLSSGEMAAAPPEAVAPPRRFPWLVAAAVVVGVLALAGAATAVALVFFHAPQPVAVAPPAPTPVTGVCVRQAEDGLHVKTAAYEAQVDPDGCLTSLRVDGVEFLRPGEPVANGQTVAKGAYFYYEKGGHHGAVRLPRIDRPAENVVVASGDKFAVRYEFNPDAVTVKPTNSTDDTVPFYVILDGTTITEVADAAGQRHSTPVVRNQSPAPDPNWKNSTWFAGRSRLTITDGSQVWGPWGVSHSQVWERTLPTYTSAEIRLQPYTGPEESKAAPPDGVLISRSYTTRRIQTELYEAVVEGDGCLSSLRVDGVEFLHPGLNVSRGSYFLGKDGPERMTDVRQPAANVLTADGPDASVRYEFGPDKITWSLDNHSDAARPFFLVFDAGVRAVRKGADGWLKPPGVVTQFADPQKDITTWFAGRSRVALTGANKLWGPWPWPGPGGYQVWEASLAPQEKRTVTAEIGRASDQEVDQAAATAGVPPAPASQMALYAPLDYQVFQRRTRTQGEIEVRGRARVDFDKVEWRLADGRGGVTPPLPEGAAPDQWQALSAPPGRFFRATLPAPAGGWYRLEVRALKDGKEVASSSVDHVGVGEVFVGAGQSNATNCGQQKIQQHSGMVASFGGTYWRPADDPQPGVHDSSMGGSFWPAFGDAMYEKFHVPIGVVSTGHSGTSVKFISN